MVTNIIISLLLIITVLVMILGMLCVDSESIELVKAIQKISVKRKRSEKINSNYVGNQKCRIVKSKMMKFSSSVKLSKLAIIIDASFFKLLTIKPFSFINTFRNFLMKLLRIKYKDEDILKIFYLKFAMEALKKLFIGNILGLTVALIYIRKARQNLSIAAYFTIISITLVLIYMPIDNLIQLRKRRLSLIKKELPKLVLKLNLLCNAGLTLSKSFEQVINENENFFQKELSSIYKQVQEGKTFIEVGKKFINTYKLKELIYFFRIITQAQIQGSNSFLQQLETLRIELQFSRLNNAKKQSEIADAKLLLPLTMVFVGIMLIVIVPVFMSII